MSGLRYLSVCSGIEAASVAWDPLGWTPVGFAEIDRFASRVLAHHYGSNMPGEPLARNGVPNFGDFTAIDLPRLGAVDLLVGGTPCQAFSVAGKRLSLSDARGNLSLAYTVLAHELAGSHGLRWAVWENVPGVLSTGDNAFGCFLGSLVGADDPLPLPRGVERWPDVGMVAGPRARAAWRVLDAQYFGLAQRRRRVFVVAGFGDGADPAAVLFERQGLRRHPPARGEAGEGVAAQIAPSLVSSGRGVERTGETRGQDPVVAIALRGRDGGSAVELGDDASFTLRASSGGSDKAHVLAFGGNRTASPFDVATAVNAHGGPHGRQDFESETFVLAGTLQANGKASGSATQQDAEAGMLVPIAFDTTQVTHPENRCNPQPGDPCHPLAAGAHAPAIAFTSKDHGQDVGEVAPTLRAMPGKHANGGGQVAVAFQGRGSNLDLGQDVTGTLAQNCDRASGGAPCVAQGWAVRRLLPVETERLQGFRDGYTAIPGAADGPRYKTHGNSFAVNVVRWIGERIDAAERARQALTPIGMR